MDVLVFSPMPSHPQHQGNSARTHRLCRVLQQSGASIHFVYYAMEGLDPEQRRAMELAWDHFHAVSAVDFHPRLSLGAHAAIDDWYDEKVGDLFEELDRRWRFRYCLMSYVWFSKALERLSPDVVKVIDTHDAFGGRHDRYIAAGLRPEWFYTSPEEEGRGLERADLVLAIQDAEKSYFESICARPVEVVGHMPNPSFRVPRAIEGAVRVGYNGSANAWNVNAFRALHREIDRRPLLADPGRVSFHLAGRLCDAVRDENRYFRLQGVVERIDDFYDGIDVAVNPMVSGTGLKIKSVEAMAFGCPLVATRDATVGLGTEHPEHCGPDVGAVCDRLEAIVRRPQDLEGLARTSRETFIAYHRRQTEAFRRVFGQ